MKLTKNNKCLHFVEDPPLNRCLKEATWEADWAGDDTIIVQYCDEHVNTFSVELFNKRRIQVLLTEADFWKELNS